MIAFTVAIEGIQGGSDASLDLFTGLLVLVGVLQVAVLGMQWWLVRRQDEHFRNSERAWILASLGWYEGGLHVAETSSLVGGIATEQTFVNVKLTCRNEGRSPAWIDMVWARVEIVSKVEGGPAPPKTELRRCGLLDPIGAGNDASRVLQLDCVSHTKPGEFLNVNVLIEYHDIFWNQWTNNALVRD
jgi:hypothetical protein